MLLRISLACASCVPVLVHVVYACICLRVRGGGGCFLVVSFVVGLCVCSGFFFSQGRLVLVEQVHPAKIVFVRSATAVDAHPGLRQNFVIFERVIN